MVKLLVKAVYLCSLEQYEITYFLFSLLLISCQCYDSLYAGNNDKIQVNFY